MTYFNDACLYSCILFNDLYDLRPPNSHKYTIKSNPTFVERVQNWRFLQNSICYCYLTVSGMGA